MDNTQLCIESYSRHKNLKLVGMELGIPWQSVYSTLRKADYPVTGDKARYGSVTDRIAVIGEQKFKKAVPISIDNNDLKYQADIDFTIGNITIDVKTSRIRRKQQGKGIKNAAPRWGYCINKQKDTADFFVLYALDDNNETEHVFLMPNEIVTAVSMISIPETLASKWADYKIEESELLPFFQSL
ncbi:MULTISPECIES: hypothetical protein [Proteus]|uniref:hypothetical protein n=1 Tax=Proteus TaxID=583 RepID=UPI000D69A9B9|nr:MULTISPECIES: hypothetical protein [Proteus]